MRKKSRKEILIAIPSMGRAGNVPIIEGLFPGCTWFICEKELKLYKKNGAKNIVIHPDDVIGDGKTYQWILDYTDEDVITIDDDIKYVWCNVGRRGRRIEDPQAIRVIIENCRLNAEEAGAEFFGFAQAWDVRKFTPNDPFSLTGWVGSVMGFRKRKIPYDQGLLLRNDISCALEHLLKNRIIWRDNRFAFVCERFNNVGGLSLVRTKENDLKDIQQICDQWGQYVKFQEVETTIGVSLRVPRRQPLKLE